jgi:anaerobic selenocysteine-containing dehydrogenase
MFVEISEELAETEGLTTGDSVIIESARGRIAAVAIVTKRIRPFNIDGQVVHQVAMPWHWGYAGLAPGDSANSLTARVADSNTMIPEYRAFLVRVSKGDTQ